MWTNAVRRSLAWLWGYAEKWVGVGQTFEKSHSRQVFETCSLISRKMVSVLQYHHQSSTTVIVKDIFLPVPIEQVEFNFAVLWRSIPFLGFFFVFQHSFYFPQLSSFQPVHLWQIQFLCPQKRGCLNPVRLFQGFTANGMATFSLAFVVQPEGVPSSNCLGNPV